MESFAVEVFLPTYTPEQALQMHMDEEFQAAAATACAASRTLLPPGGYINGNCFERQAIFDSHGNVPEGYFRQVFQNATPQVMYREVSRYFAPPSGTVDIEILTPQVASECVSVHVDLQFLPAQGGGTIRALQGQVNVSGYVPRLLRGWGERLIARQLESRLAVGAGFAQSWAVANPYRYPDQLRPDETAETAALLAEPPAALLATSEAKPAAQAAAPAPAPSGAGIDPTAMAPDQAAA